MIAPRVIGTIAAGAAILLALSADFARAQSANVTPPPVDPRTRNGVSAEQLQKLAWIRYLQGRSGGGGGNVQRGVPQFVPMGGQMPFGNMMNQGGAAQPQSQPGAAGATDLDADQDKKSVAEKKAEYAAAREEKKRKAKERAEKRKAELAERRAKSGGK